jgi:hypothetical protein
MLECSLYEIPPDAIAVRWQVMSRAPFDVPELALAEVLVVLEFLFMPYPPRRVRIDRVQ